VFEPLLPDKPRGVPILFGNELASRGQRPIGRRGEYAHAGLRDYLPGSARTAAMFAHLLPEPHPASARRRPPVADRHPNGAAELWLAVWSAARARLRPSGRCRRGSLTGRRGFPKCQPAARARSLHNRSFIDRPRAGGMGELQDAPVHRWIPVGRGSGGHSNIFVNRETTSSSHSEYIRDFIRQDMKAAHDLREARSWSHARWSKLLTYRYFEDLHKGAVPCGESSPPFVRRSSVQRLRSQLLSRP
jgi:hypothetical protein